MDEVVVSELEPDVHLIVRGERQIILIGTAHISQKSVDTVRRITQEHKTQSVCIELCGPRLDNLNDPERWRQTDLFRVIRNKQGYVLMSQLIVAGFQRRLGQKLGVKPGDEMRAAVEIATQLNLPIHPVDREIRVTLKRTWAGSGLLSLGKIIAALVTSLFSKEEVTEEQLETLKQKDVLSAALVELSKLLPGIKTSLIDERDQYMAAKISTVPELHTVAIVGAGHVPGILSNLFKEIDLAKLETVSTRNKYLFPLLKYLLGALLIGGLLWLGFSIGFKHAAILVGTWAIVNGIFAAAATALCLAHPLTIFAALISSPLAAIHPGFAVGWVCALVEAYLRKPRVQDFEDLMDFNGSKFALLKNRVSRILILLVVPNLGSVIGTVVAVYFLSAAAPK